MCAEHRFPICSGQSRHGKVLQASPILPGRIESRDRTELQLGGGIRYLGSQGISASLEYTTIQGRTNVDADIIGVSFTYRRQLYIVLRGGSGA